MILYHGSASATRPTPSTGGVFDGLFCSCEPRVAASHGDYVHEYSVPADQMLTHYALNYEVSDLDAIRAVLSAESAPGADIVRVWEIVIEDRGQCIDVELFRGANDAGEAGWEAQRIRGSVAAALGYAAIEMEDEHGTTWLLVARPEQNHTEETQS